jgi:hypothetical protein
LIVLYSSDSSLIETPAMTTLPSVIRSIAGHLL